MSDDESEGGGGGAGETSDGGGRSYTREQKIVSAVWVHERFYNEQTWSDIGRNFRARFNVSPPMRSTLLNWERKLFTQGNVDDREKSGRPLARLMHVPYVRASLRDSPDLSLRERARVLGLPRTTLLKILREDLDMEFEVDAVADGSRLPTAPSLTTDVRRRHLPYNCGKWKKRRSDESEATDQPATATVVTAASHDASTPE